MSGRQHSEGEAILAKQRKLINQRRWRDANKEQIRARYRNGEISNRPNQCNSIWTPERHAELVSLFEEKLTAAEIGRRMGLSKNAVIGRLDRHGLHRRDPSKQGVRRGEYLGPTSMERLDALRDKMDAVIWATRKENWTRMN